MLRDGRCYDRCGVNGPVCEDEELCVRFSGETACRQRCGIHSGTCPVGNLCYVLETAEEREGFCAPGACPVGSHRGAWGYCVCDTGDIPPPELPCVVELCGPGNRRGECPGEQLCVDGVCR